MSRLRDLARDLGLYMLDGHTPVKTDDLDAWMRCFEQADRTVAVTELPSGIVVSTVFLGVDHGWRRDGQPPILFETMVFSDYGGDDIDRYSTWEEAVAGHDAMVAKLKEEA